MRDTKRRCGNNEIYIEPFERKKVNVSEISRATINLLCADWTIRPLKTTCSSTSSSRKRNAFCHK